MTAALPKTTERYVRVAHEQDLDADRPLLVKAEGRAIALVKTNGQIYAIDNRCPHMGFPLHQGSVKNCILTCHWHHARFDLTSGGTFDIWADDGRAFPVKVDRGEIWVDIAEKADPVAHQRQRLQDGLEQSISLILAKAALGLLDGGVAVSEPFQTGLSFGARYRQAGWSTGLTIHTSLFNLLPYLDAADRSKALYHGLSAVARDCSGEPPRFLVQPLPSIPDLATLKAWFRQFVEVRDTQGAQRCLVSAVQAGVSRTALADMLFAAATDHRLIDGGHTLDFTNKALEALDATDWQDADWVLTSLVRGYAHATRMEESNEWRHPIDLVELLTQTFAQLETALETGQPQRGSWSGRAALVPTLLANDPHAIADSLLAALRQGATETDLAETVAYAAALRIAQFSSNNDFRDWDTAHHTFTFANAVHQGLQRVPSVALLRGVFDAAVSVYLDRFLNMPPARLPNPAKQVDNPEALLAALPELLDKQQQVAEAGQLVGRYLYSGGDPQPLLAMLGHLLLREDRDFHTIQNVEAAFRLYQHLQETDAGIHILVATARYLAAHAPTVRSQGQTYQMAYRLHKGDRVFEAD
ncbi:MAG: Rieske 2Fe-2S domain-containing protein [Leptolyngbya sp. SIO4C1]|nr:Rieske 2Fe-2S domain-containing protein [Leptolyngbya sp. SIO4C1]